MRYAMVLLTAGQNLFDSAWTEGNLYSIQPIVNILGSFSVKVISFVGFGIVIFSILKNAMSGLYVVNPNFWDRVSDVKRQLVGEVSGIIQDGASRVPGQGNAIAQRLGGIMTFLLQLLPDIRALTDFDDGVPVDKKQYFMKSIPLLIAQIFIGMLIFMGYPSKIAEWIGNGGTYMITAMINNIDPIEVVTGISDSITVYNLSTDGSPDPFDRTVNKGASEMIRVVQTKYRDMQKDPTQETAYALETYLQNALESDTIRSIIGASEGYDVVVNAISQSSPPTYSNAFKVIVAGNGYNTVMAQATNGTIQIKTWIAGQALPTGSTLVKADDYFVWTITATPVALSKTSTSNMIMFGGLSSPTADTSGKINLTIQGITLGNGANDLRGTPTNMIVDSIDATGTVVHSYTATLQTASVNQVTGATPILTFAATDRENLVSDVQQNGCYLRVNLAGSWSYDVTADNSTTTISVTELRLKIGGSKGFALTVWDDVTLATSSSSVTDPASALKRGSMAGSQ